MRHFGQMNSVMPGSPSNGPSEWQEEYNAQAAHSRRILSAAE